MYFLAGDVGGTKAILQLIRQSGHRAEFEVVAQTRYECCQFDNLQQIVQTFLAESVDPPVSIDAASFGLPGPVSGRQVQLTNLPWVVDADALLAECPIERVELVNDFYAAALGIDVVEPTCLEALYQPDKPITHLKNRLVIGAGTGLGVAPIYFDGGRYWPQSSEGGHFDFAPISETQQLILNWLWQRWPHVSYERLLSGEGIETLYQFFHQHVVSSSFSISNSQNLNKNKIFNQQNNHLGLLVAESKQESASPSLTAPEIHALAEAGDLTAEKALVEFVTIYGAYVGAAALLWNAPGGIYLAGGIAAKLLRWMRHPAFLAAYLEKGRMSHIVAGMPVYVVTDETLGLKGAMLHNFQKPSDKC